MISRYRSCFASVLFSAISVASVPSHAAELRLPVAVVSEVEHIPAHDSSISAGFYSVADLVRLTRLNSVEVPEQTAGEVAIDQFVGSWQMGDMAIFRVEAAEGYMFRISPHPDTDYSVMESIISFSTGGDILSESELAVTFENLQGTAPTLNSALGDLYGLTGDLGRYISYGFTYEVTGPFTFTAFEASFVTTSPGQLNALGANSNFLISVDAGARRVLADHRLLELIPIPEPSSALLLLAGIAMVSFEVRKPIKSVLIAGIFGKRVV